MANQVCPKCGSLNVDFQVQQETSDFYRITLKDPDGNTSSLLLHSGLGS